MRTEDAPQLDAEYLSALARGEVEFKKQDDDDDDDAGDEQARGGMKAIASLLADMKKSYKSGQEDLRKEIDALEAKLNRLGANPDVGLLGKPARAPEDVKAWNTYLRSGETKDMMVSADPQGGYAVDAQWSSRIIQTVFQSSPMRQICTVESVSSDALELLTDHNDLESGWVGETQTRSDTTTPDIGRIRIPVHEVYSQPRATQKLLDDARFDIEGWLTGKVAKKFARDEATAFVSGDGINRPRGFLTHTIVANASWEWGKIGYIASGGAGAFAASNPADKLKQLKYSLKSEYRDGARWLMNSDTAALIAQFKDTTGRYIWAESVAEGDPPTLFGSPVTFAEDMPAIAADSYSVAYGNFKDGYTIADRFGIRILRDPFTAKPYVRFYSTMRVGGDVVNFEALKVMKFASS